VSDNDGGTDGPESEEAIDSHAEEDRFRRKETRRVECHSKDLQRGNGKARMRSAYHYPNRYGSGATSTSAFRHEIRTGHSYPPRTIRPWDDDMDVEPDVDIDIDSYIDEDRIMSKPVSRTPIRRPWPTTPVGLADLDSPAGR
jgi:hypothetical protein